MGALRLWKRIWGDWEKSLGKSLKGLSPPTKPSSLRKELIQMTFWAVTLDTSWGSQIQCVLKLTLPLPLVHWLLHWCSLYYEDEMQSHWPHLLKKERTADWQPVVPSCHIWPVTSSRGHSLSTSLLPQPCLCAGPHCLCPNNPGENILVPSHNFFMWWLPEGLFLNSKLYLHPSPSNNCDFPLSID